MNVLLLKFQRLGKMCWYCDCYRAWPGINKLYAFLKINKSENMRSVFNCILTFRLINQRLFAESHKLVKEWINFVYSVIQRWRNIQTPQRRHFCLWGGSANHYITVLHYIAYMNRFLGTPQIMCKMLFEINCIHHMW